MNKFIAIAEDIEFVEIPDLRFFMAHDWCDLAKSISSDYDGLVVKIRYNEVGFISLLAKQLNVEIYVFPKAFYNGTIEWNTYTSKFPELDKERLDYLRSIFSTDSAEQQKVDVFSSDISDEDDTVDESEIGDIDA